MTDRESCPNYEINAQQCPCPAPDCERHAICCECLAAHAPRKSLTACLKETRPEETRDLPKGQNPDCANRARNAEQCPCDAADCSRRGLCCDCIRHHWGHSTYPLVACMQEAS